MIDSSAKYGLCNPAFTNDIGYNMLGNIVGNRIQDLDEYRLSGTEYTMDDIAYKNMLKADKFESSTKKDKLKDGLIFGGSVILAALLCWKFGGKIKDLLKKIPGVSGLGRKISAGFSSIKSKIKMPSFGGIFKKIKLPSLKGIGSKIKNLFKRKPVSP